MKKITMTSVIQFLKNIQIIDWMLILLGLITLVLAFISKGSFSSKVLYIVIAISQFAQLIKNRKYRLIVGLIGLAFIIYWFCSI